MEAGIEDHGSVGMRRCSGSDKRHAADTHPQSVSLKLGHVIVSEMRRFAVTAHP
jgi:hypothetical protein